MLVRDIMQPQVLTVAPQTPLPEAARLMQERWIRHLPVVKDEALVGIVSDRDLKGATALVAAAAVIDVFPALEAGPTVEAIMTRSVVVVGPDAPVEEAVRIMAAEKIGALPVVEGGRLIGIVTETDALGLIVRGMGAQEPSSRLDVTLDENRSSLAEVIRVVEQTGAPVASVLTLRRRDGRRDAVIRVATIHPGRVVRALEDRGYGVRKPSRA